jgi:hypothetical protein
VLRDQWQRRWLLRRAGNGHDDCDERTRREAEGFADRRAERLLWFVREQLLRLSGPGGAMTGRCICFVGSSERAASLRPGFREHYKENCHV